MLHNVKSTKLQVTLIDGDHPEGLNRVFNNLVAQPSDEQIAPQSAARLRTAC